MTFFLSPNQTRRLQKMSLAPQSRFSKILTVGSLLFLPVLALSVSLSSVLGDAPHIKAVTSVNYSLPVGCSVSGKSRFVSLSCADHSYEIQSFYYVSRFNLPGRGRSGGPYYGINNDAYQLGCYYKSVCRIEAVVPNAFGRYAVAQFRAGS